MVNDQAQVVMGGDDVEATTSFFADLGFRLTMLMPADDPRIADLEGFGLSLRLDTSLPRAPLTIRVPVAEAPVEASIVAPNGVTVEFVASTSGAEPPALAPSFVLSRRDGADWTVGRAGMGYRDLIPDRQGGRFIASHIHLRDGGPVPDYVHHHRIRFQLLYCYRGWARLVYEDQGPPFRFEAGDCVLQPPHIRHQVLETSAAFDVVEIGCPAEHETFRDHDLHLPTGRTVPDRDYQGQRFVHHRRSAAVWEPAEVDGYAHCDFGLAAATNGLVAAGVSRAEAAGTRSAHRHEGELRFWFVLGGRADLAGEQSTESLAEADSVVLAPGHDYRLATTTPGFEVLEIDVPSRT